MSLINVDFESFKGASSQFKSVAHTIKSREAQIKSITESLMSSWKGESKQAFEREYNDLVKSMYNYEEILIEMAKELDSICETFKEADEEIGRNIAK